ncbi:MAG: hypothetical protein CR974_02015 [Gammaproteobacteria bacterium]|nr:MAG: hypothetical protein CR974_02015 [Gammaproteobacteria bacterium]
MNKTTQVSREEMTIYKPVKLTNTPDGGGLMTGEPFTGAKNEAFAPVSNMQRLNGGLDMVKMFPAVLRGDDAPVYGANFIIAMPPQTPNWSFVAFKAANEAEKRASAAERLATYIIKTVRSRMTLYATQTAGSRVVQAYQNVDAPLPSIGQVYCLNDGNNEQYIRIESMSDRVETFTDKQNNDFKKRVLTIVTRNRLDYSFVGMSYPERGFASPDCIIYDTHVADGAQFYGVQRAAENALKDQRSVVVESLTEKIIPTSVIETPLPNLTVSGATTGFLDAAKAGNDGVVEYATNQVFGNGTALYTGSPIVPNSLTIESGNVTFTDNAGQLLANGQPVGTVSYGEGKIVAGEDLPNYYSRKKLRFRPAGVTTAASDTDMIVVTTANRRKNYVRTIKPSPTRGSLSASYCAQGKWYTLTDNGTGALLGASVEYGTGAFNFDTDTLTLTLETPPDAGTAILLSWATSGNQFNRASDVILTPQVTLDLPKIPVSGTLTVTHASGTCSDAGDGSLSGGDLTGRIVQSHLDFNLAALPDHGSEYVMAFSANTLKYGENITPSGSSGGVFNLQLAHGNIARRSLRIATQVVATLVDGGVGDAVYVYSGGSGGSKPTLKAYARNVGFSDDGNGNIVNTAGDTVGTVNYTTGEVAVNPGTSFDIFVRKLFGGYKAKSTYFQNQGANFAVSYAAGSAESDTYTHAISTITIDLTPRYGEHLVAGSVAFKLGDWQYYDKAGKLYCNLDPATGKGKLAGTINYQTGIATLTHWPAGASVFTLISLLTTTNAKAVPSVAWRVPMTPIAVADFQVLGATTTGDDFNVTANPDGSIVADGLRGSVDSKTGIAQLEFGKLVPAAGNESADWYDVSKVDSDGNIWQPNYVYPETLTCNATAESSVPMDDTSLGVDTARLPSDGKVPIYRKGDTVVIASRWQQTLPEALTAGQTIQLNQTDLTVMCLQDSDNKHVEASWYDYDLQAGTVTFATPLDLSGYTLPLIATYAYEEENVITDTDINGTLTLRFPLKRSFDKLNCFVSTVLRAGGTGNLRVRATEPFSQLTWSGRWSDERDESPILAKLNVRDHPIQLTDDGAMTERWLIKFTNTEQFELYGETLGLVAKGDIWQDLAPINPATGRPLLVIKAAAFSSGGVSAWNNGNCIRFNTYGTAMPVWLIRAVQPSADPQIDDDGYAVAFRADTIAA